MKKRKNRTKYSKETKRGKVRSREKNSVGNIFNSPPIKILLNTQEHDFYRADIEFHGVNHSGPSYEGRVFVNNLDADENTQLDDSNNYVGSYHIFGHNGCFGDVGHCDMIQRRTYDSRPQHPLTPAFKSLVATRIIKKVLKSTDTVTVTIVPIISRGGRMRDAKDVVDIQRIRINGYENYSKLSKT